MKPKQPLKVITGEKSNVISTLSDDDLMRLSALNRKDAFEVLVFRHQSIIFALAARYLGDRDKGRDVTQDVFLALWAERLKYRPQGNFKSYLTSVCLNRCRVVIRSAKRRAEKDRALAESLRASPVPDREIPLQDLLESEQRREIQQLLTTLPNRCREVLIFRFTHEMPLQDVSEMTGMPLGTVKSHLMRGLSKLRQIMSKRGMTK